MIISSDGMVPPSPDELNEDVTCRIGRAFAHRFLRSKRPPPQLEGRRDPCQRQQGVDVAVYGGEVSAHHYFCDFTYCDTGMVPWLLIAERISITVFLLHRWWSRVLLPTHAVAKSTSRWAMQRLLCRNYMTTMQVKPWPRIIRTA